MAYRAVGDPGMRAAAFAAGLLSGCGPSTPERVRSQPPAPPHTGAPLPLTQIDRPVDLAKFDADPCGLLTTDQVATVVADPPARRHPREQARRTLNSATPGPTTVVRSCWR